MTITTALATTILQSGRGESRAVVLDFKTVEDLPDVSSPLETYRTCTFYFQTFFSVFRDVEHELRPRYCV